MVYIMPCGRWQPLSMEMLKPFINAPMKGVSRNKPHKIVMMLIWEWNLMVSATTITAWSQESCSSISQQGWNLSITTNFSFPCVNRYTFRKYTNILPTTMSPSLKPMHYLMLDTDLTLHDSGTMGMYTTYRYRCTSFVDSLDFFGLLSGLY